MSKKDKIDELSKRMHKGAIDAFTELRRLQMLTINIKIATSKMGDHPETRALAKSGDIIKEALISLEQSTMDVRDLAKEIGRVNHEEE